MRTQRDGEFSHPCMGVLVSSTATKSGSTVSGDTKKIVVVKTGAGYSGSPGKAGTGTIVATYC